MIFTLVEVCQIGLRF